MSSDEDDFAPGISNLANKKQKRLPRACDHCRKRKSDSSQMPRNRCSNCISFNLECTHTIPVRKRGPQKRYVEDLESRINKMEELLHKLNPGMDVAKELTKGSANSESNSPESFALVAGSSPEDIVDDDEDERTQNELNERLKQLDIQSLPLRFFGKSSSFMLMKSALNVKEEYVGKMSLECFERLIRRDKFWQMETWELSLLDDQAPHIAYRFPEPDLMRHLIEVFFADVQPVLNILHRPTFERELQSGLHHHDRDFGGMVLALCAVASRVTNEPRTWLDPGDRLSAGWDYFDQINLMRRRSLFEVSSLHEIQCYCLVILYINATNTPQGSWNVLGMALRYCEEVGVHRRSSATKTPQTEQWKRAFWTLTILDRLSSAFLGRPTALHHDDIDVEFPIECDDEYWESTDGSSSFMQPEGTLARTATYFNTLLKVVDLHSIAFRNLYTTAKFRLKNGRAGVAWDQRIVSELDSELNKWMDSVPHYLRWDPNRDDRTTFMQSSMLYCAYYYIQIQIHRPFIHKESPLAFPSLAICMNAARSSARLLQAQLKKGWILRLPQMFILAFSAGIVLLLNIWGGRKRGLALDQEREMHDVQSCMAFLSECEKTHHIPGRFNDLLRELLSIGEHCQGRDGQQYQGNCPGQRLSEGCPRQEGDRQSNQGNSQGSGQNLQSGGQELHQCVMADGSTRPCPQEVNGTQLGGAQQLGGTQQASGPLSFPPSQTAAGSAKKRTYDDFDATGWKPPTETAGWQSSTEAARWQPSAAMMHSGEFDKSWEARPGMGGAAGMGRGNGTGEPSMRGSAHAPTGGSARIPHALLPSDGFTGHPYSTAEHESYMAAADLYMRGLEDGARNSNAAGTGVPISADMLSAQWSGFTGASGDVGVVAIGGDGGTGSVPGVGGMRSISDTGDMGSVPTEGIGNVVTGGLDLPSNTGDASMHGGQEPYPDLVLDDDIMAMWNSAPAAFDTQSWEVYLSAMASQPMHEI
ncbi:fungal-specific transcription factor domain-containing protein [Schizophyllum amplum]|uniref:Fungal-specific transcription factor domain-containing protein n=1 Tax=Schizophyllum amplum TaxID=97359 RepID=A0A550CX92_9AGAR|nr:fungal-specific transcription factor domain-containing protein [Auriculariopsis ampla]